MDKPDMTEKNVRPFGRVMNIDPDAIRYPGISSIRRKLQRYFDKLTTEKSTSFGEEENNER